MRSAVVGHVEWVQFLRVATLPTAGEIAHASDFWEDAAGGGSGAAAQLFKLTGDTAFFTALGDDAIGASAAARLASFGLELHNETRQGVPTRRAVTFVDSAGERTITVVGERLNPGRDGPLPWDLLPGVDACYFTAGDTGALEAARQARVLVATTRVLPVLAEAGVHLDAVVGSSDDPAEAYRHGDLDPVPALAVLTEGERGGSFSVNGGEWLRYEPVSPPGLIVDRYGAGDSFAGALAFALGAGASVPDAIQLAARCGAAVLTGRGPYEGQLGFPDVSHLLPGTPERG